MNIDKIYELRKSFTIIALTGRTGSGCTTIAERLTMKFDNDSEVFRDPSTISLNHNSYRKYRIVYNYAKENLKPHILISYRDVLVLCLLKKSFTTFIDFLSGEELRRLFDRSKLSHLSELSDEIERLKTLENRFEDLVSVMTDLELNKGAIRLSKLHRLFVSSEFINLSSDINNILQFKSKVKRNKVLQIIGDNLRSCGRYESGTNKNLSNVFSISIVINDLIKSFHKKSKGKGKSTEIVIDSLRNPLEIMFFRQRFSAFYTMSVNRTEDLRKQEIINRYKNDNIKDVNALILDEYNGAKSKDFYKQNVSQCIQSADIHIAFKEYDEMDLMNREIELKKDNASPYFSWQMQLLKFMALIDQPGIVTPSPEERCMQLAFTAKYNSGCISRQVGASVTDANYAVKAIGWNSTPEGQVPCSLRNADDLISNTGDIDAFTTYEKTNKQFQKVFRENYSSSAHEEKRKDLKGRNVCFCFKTLINSYSDGKNQVHTRSLHAEESAFLQISKYGGQGVQNGKLFTTASPCELCSKKAYQLGIKVIYYIDPYPGISLEHILTAGSPERNPTMRLFHGAIGNAYHWLYEPFMSFKDELNLILEHNIKDLATNKQELLNIKTNELLNAHITMQSLTEENEKLKEQIAALNNS